MKPEKNLQDSFYEFLVNVKDYFFHLIDLREDTDKQGTIDSIKKYVVIRGYNVWILMCAAMIASIGLDTNSAAIIIGAMLISPLMSPILGIGLSIGINDRKTLSLSIQNFFVAIVVSILTSYLYFRLTPLGLATPELLARTKPTLLDVGVALFGGIAGIVAGSHKDKTNALPGVAIATALMPPLCTVGFGLAKGKLLIWGGALYLFFINAVIISASTYLVVRYLRFPYKEYADLKDKRKTAFFIGIFVVAVTIPSIFILSHTLDRIANDREINKFIKQHINDEQREVLDWDRVETDSTALLKFYIVGESIPEDSIPMLNHFFNDHHHPKIPTQISLIQFKKDVSRAEFDEIRFEMTNSQKVIIEEVNKQLENKLQTMSALQQQVKLLETDSIPVYTLQKELHALYPEIRRLGASRVTEMSMQDSVQTQIKLPYFQLAWDNTTTNETAAANEQRIYSYLKVRLGVDTLKIGEF